MMMPLAAVLIACSAQVQPTPLEPGLTYRLFDIGRPLDHLAALKPDQTPNIDRRIDRLNLGNADFGGPGDYFVVQAFGYLHVDDAGDYGVELISDDGARLTINNALVVQSDGVQHGEDAQRTVPLNAGDNTFSILMFENEGDAYLRLKWKPPGAERYELIPASAFRIEKGVTRVVSPGRKVYLDGREHLRPGDGLPVEGVHPAWTIEPLRPKGFEPQVGGMDFLPDGRLVISTFRPINNGVFRERANGALWLLKNVIRKDGDAESGTPAGIVPTRIADDLHDPLGVVVVDGDIYVSHRPGIDRFRDLDHDGDFESREVFATPWISDNYHNFSFGLQAHDGWIYGGLSTSIYFDSKAAEREGVQGEVISYNGPNPPHRGTVYRVNIKTRQVEFIAGGLRTPNGILVTKSGEVFATDNQGAWLPGNKLINVKPGRFYGHYNSLQRSTTYPEGGAPSLFADRPVSPPAVWLVQNEVSNSPTTPLTIDDGPFAGQLLVAELTAGGLRRVCLETVNGEQQGAVFQCSQGFECGVNRLIKGPDGCLYAGGTGADSDWSWRGTRFGLQRLRPTGKTAFEYHSLSATPDGFIVRFTRPVPAAWLADAKNYTIKQWTYTPTPEYGGPKVNEETLAVSQTAPAPDGRSVRLTIPGLRPGYVVYLRTDPHSTSGETFWATEAWYTLNAIPKEGLAH